GVAVEQAAHDSGAAGISQELALVADQAARRAEKGQAQLTAARWTHFLHLGFAAAHLVDDDPGELLVDVDHDLFDRLQPLTRRRREPPRSAADRARDTPGAWSAAPAR